MIDLHLIWQWEVVNHINEFAPCLKSVRVPLFWILDMDHWTGCILLACCPSWMCLAQMCFVCLSHQGWVWGFGLWKLGSAICPPRVFLGGSELFWWQHCLIGVMFICYVGAVDSDFCVDFIVIIIGYNGLRESQCGELKAFLSLYSQEFYLGVPCYWWGS